MKIVWTDVFDGVTFKVANHREQFEALRKRGEIYQRELGAEGIDEFDVDAHHLVAVDASSQVVSAMRVITRRPLEIESYLSLSAIADSTLTTAQTGGYWVDERWRVVRHRRFLQVGMLKLAFMFGRSNGIRQFVMYTYDRLTVLYRAAFFEQLELTFNHSVWGQVRVLKLDVADVARKCARSETPLAQLMLAEGLSNFHV